MNKDQEKPSTWDDYKNVAERVEEISKRIHGQNWDSSDYRSKADYQVAAVVRNLDYVAMYLGNKEGHNRRLEKEVSELREKLAYSEKHWREGYDYWAYAK